jgi:LysM domain
MSARFLGFSGFALAVLVNASGPSVAAAADRPPQDLHLVGDHWTAWNPPTPPPGTQVHVIQRGDTLWDLAARFYGNAYLWPQLWERNQYVLDAHWIYPGDPLVLGIEVAPVDQLTDLGDGGAPAGEETPPSEPMDGVLTAGAAAGSPVPLGAESDIYCSGYVGAVDEAFPYAIVGAEFDVLTPELTVGAGIYSRVREGKWGPVGSVKYGMATGDIVYVDGGQSRGLSPGALFTAIAPQQEIVHPVRRDPYGRFYRYLGRLRILSVQEETAIAEIVHSCDPIPVGTLLRPFQPEPVPLGRPTAMRPVNYPAQAEKLLDAPVILFSQDDIVSLGEDHVVHIDRGTEDDVLPGDIYTIYRQNRKGLPPVVLGELAVLSVHPHSSVAKIIRSRYPIYVGDRLEAK